MFQDLCSIGPKKRLTYQATFHDYRKYNDVEYVLLKGVMLNGIKLLDKLKFERKYVGRSVVFEKGDIVSFEANVQQCIKPIKYLSMTKPVYTSYYYELIKIGNVKCANRVEESETPDILKDKDVKIFIVYNSFKKEYVVEHKGKKSKFPFSMTFDEINNCLGA